jgi:hypothetical protein
MRRLGSIVVVALLSLTGCPGGTPAATQASGSLLLSFNGGGPGGAKVGERRAMTVSCGAPQEGEQLISSALIAQESGPNLTRWHADPEDAVTFEDGGAAATFKRPGKVKIWASVTGEDGREVSSNALEVTVSQ